MSEFKILMVCLGNICRSPIAEGLMRQKITLYNLPWEVDSAAVGNYYIGKPPHQFAQLVCKGNGIDISHQRARLLTINDFDKFDKIYAMDESIFEEAKKIAGNHHVNRLDLFLNEINIENKNTPDPYYGYYFDFKLVYKLVEQVCDQIVQKYKHFH
ncbi:MAG: low molecular weight phosphotyrosine protein phosphatase [Sediminibacterium sp.]|nr:low molecular weight phosphotyrosine protein phosphatase [Sediminibacterium sp.]